MEICEQKLGEGFQNLSYAKLTKTDAGRDLLDQYIALARTNFLACRFEAAVAWYEKLFTLWPAAPTHYKSELLSFYLDMERYDSAQQLVERFPKERDISWTLGRALLTFRQQGDSAEAQTLLKEVFKTNPEIAPALLSPQIGEPVFSSITQHRAYELATWYVRPWAMVPGAFAWLRKHDSLFQEAHPELELLPTWRQIAPDLELLQRSGESWLVDLVSEDAVPHKGSRCALVVVDEEDLSPIYVRRFRKKPTPNELLVRLGLIMLGEDGEHQRLPERVSVRVDTLASKLTAPLKSLGIACDQGEHWEQFDAIARQWWESQSDAQSAAMLAQWPVEKLAQLPLEPGETWQCRTGIVDAWVLEQGEFHRVMVTLICLASEPHILHQLMTTTPPSEIALRSVLAQSIGAPQEGEPHRPQTVEVATSAERAALWSLLEPLDIACEVVSEMPALDEAWADLMEHMRTSGMEQDHAPPSVTMTPGITPEQLATFYQAAATFFRRRVWRYIADDRRINIACPHISCESVDAVVMGQAGGYYGLALHEDRAGLEKLLNGELEAVEEDAAAFDDEEEDDELEDDALAVDEDELDADDLDEDGDEDADDEERALAMLYRDQTGMSLLFGEAHEISFDDLNTIEARKFEVAAPEAFPKMLHFERGIMRAPLRWEVDLLTGSMEALAEFVLQASNPAAKLAWQTPAGHPITLTWV